MPQATGFSIAHLDYLQRHGFVPAVPPPPAGPASRRLWQVRGIGRLDKTSVPREGERIHLPSEDLLVGLYTYKIPVAFLVRGDPGGVAVHLGTWSEGGAGQARSLDTPGRVLKSLAGGLYPSIDLHEASIALPPSSLSGLVMGIPTLLSPSVADPALPLDRLIRANAGGTWAALVLAQPVDEVITRCQRDATINEIRSAAAAARAAGTPTPLAEYYDQLLQTALNACSEALAVGFWRTAVYLLGDEASYYSLASAWRGIFCGTQSLPEPVRVWDVREAAALAAAWALPEVEAPRGPGFYTQLLQHQTLLSSSQLAVYVHLPQVETSGFSVNVVADFDVVPPAVPREQPTIHLGDVLDKADVTQNRYEVPVSALTKHAFISGITGSGKTNTIRHILLEATRRGIPFLVVEPAKREYRQLANHPELAGRLHVFTLGSETAAPFRLNPFDVEDPDRTPVGVHLDLLRSAFTASFGMWTPLPQILEECLHRAYAARGWDITTGSNSLLESGSLCTPAFPTLSDLLVEVEEVTAALGYEQKIADDFRAALRTRIKAMCAGGKGHMLDGQRSIPMKALLEHATVLELEGMGDDDDKAFMLGLLLTRLAESRRAQGKSGELRHLLVIEEAHRLLANVSAHGREEEGNPRGKAVETFANLLAEIRAYGQGVIVADQSPVKLAPDVIKNTNLKIAHRVVAAEDREVLGSAMGMTERHKQALATLKPNEGQAAAFAEGDDVPLLIKVPWVGEQPAPDDTQIRGAWARWTRDAGVTDIYRAYSTCLQHCPAVQTECASARRVAEGEAIREAMAALVLSFVWQSQWCSPNQLPELLQDLYRAVETTVRPRCPGAGEDVAYRRCVLTHALYRHLHQRAARHEWKYGDVAMMVDRLLPALLAVGGAQAVGADAAEGLVHFSDQYMALSKRVGPFYGCERACRGTCLWRYAVEPLVLSEAVRKPLVDALDEESVQNDAATDGDGGESKTFEKRVDDLCTKAVEPLVIPTDDSMPPYGAKLCLVIQQAAGLTEFGWPRRRSLVDRMTVHIVEQQTEG